MAVASQPKDTVVPPTVNYQKVERKVKNTGVPTHIHETRIFGNLLQYTIIAWLLTRTKIALTLQIQLVQYLRGS